ncbi:MAG: hypothetical protein IKZ37_02660 [Bacteroidaceae bacterium]|nr:hypothetical protein [Bacteroidaceae bacterium]
MANIQKSSDWDDNIGPQEQKKKSDAHKKTQPRVSLRRTAKGELND